MLSVMRQENPFTQTFDVMFGGESHMIRMMDVKIGFLILFGFIMVIELIVFIKSDVDRRNIIITIVTSVLTILIYIFVSTRSTRFYFTGAIQTCGFVFAIQLIKIYFIIYSDEFILRKTMIFTAIHLLYPIIIASVYFFYWI